MPILDHIPGMKNAMRVAVFDVHALSEEVFVGEYVLNSRPCLVKGAVRHWPAFQNWRDPAHLKARCGDQTVFYYPHENHITPDRMRAGKIRMGFGEALDRLHAEDTRVATLGFSGELEALRPDLRVFPFFRRAAPAFFVPPARQFVYRNAGTAWHYHSFDETFMCQVVGSKTVGMLKAGGANGKAVSEVFFKEDYYDDPGAFEALEETGLDWFSADVEEGDALYIPPLWWHGVSAASNSFGMTVAVAWRSPPHVIADTIRKMTAGEIRMHGYARHTDVAPMLAVARELGLERELSVLLETA